MARTNKGGLGKGFGALLGESLREDTQNSTGISTLPMALVEPNPEQPRKVFDPEGMEALKKSISTHGIITPITVRTAQNGYYQIIAGERRWRAARSIGLTEIPAFIIEADDQKVMELALIENLQREDLNPIEEAKGYSTLIKQFNLTQEQVAERVGKSRPSVANALRLLALPEEAQLMVASGGITAGHARAILSIQDEERRLEAIEKMATMTVRQAEKYARDINRIDELESSNTPVKPIFEVDYLSEISREIENNLGRKVQIEQGKKSGLIKLEFYNQEDLERLTAALRELKI
ncbi:MAG TPA: ParB/RepB/Spo0J family partition protein [Candidatus Butyricicoccus avistercoris]|uniref:ParB/RepB/Spo0J family partition protein n=1 Tax=Candidatus Butyricicoccus avistercoris TaxID=2838518 RepID=A0A9D1PIM6_9FIRM|nr:ParB/RepB/Spo0J family partition protein [Candidatus Butyricicoccus avistercoris]